MTDNNDRSRRLLLVDDEPLNLDMLGRRLATRGYDVETATSGLDALQKLEEKGSDLVLLDVNMPGMSGLDVLDKLRADEATAALPVILVSALSDTDNIVRGLQRGANDYVTKPINLPILLARLETQLKMASLVNQLEAQKEVLARLAAYDDLTGVFNRRSLFEALETDLGRSLRYRHELSVLMMDLDHFKKVNDVHGHQAGDEVLRLFAERISRTLRSTDALFRYGGEEFTAVLPETNHVQASRVAELIRNAVMSNPFPYEDKELLMTVSIGLATFTPPESVSATELLERADKALYEAKHKGRNRVCCFADGTHDTPWAAAAV